jgi:hypothetical protein
MSIKRLLLRYVSVIVFRELLRTDRISAESKAGAMTLVGIALLPFGVVLFGSYPWWLLTGPTNAGTTRPRPAAADFDDRGVRQPVPEEAAN